jgi:succinate dehydrogenase / fumarate reductase, membrane anchor subunit
MSLKSPLGRVLGLGSAKEGTGHWWSTRLAAIALVPLLLWLVLALLMAPSLDYAGLHAFVRAPLNALGLVLLVPVAAYHSLLGVREVVEDYVHARGAKVVSLVLLDFVHVLAAVAGLYAVLRVSFGGTP